MRQKKISELCPTLFSPEESRIFLGTSLIKKASKETDRKSREEMYQKAINLLLKDPSQIELAQVVPDLAKDWQFEKIVQIALSKLI